ncbi:MAG: hypothetical protein Q8K40_01640 [Ignavibacteria bacterium]|nr:hypothetical protein [Ignavibacteria bacterium]
MVNLTDSNSDLIKLELNTNGIKQLYMTRKWTLFLSILGFVFIGLTIIIVVVAFLITGTNYSSSNFSALALLPLLTIALIYFFPIYFLYQFSSYSNKAIKNNDSIQLSKALKYLKNHYQFMGILIIVVIGIYFVLGAILLSSGKFLNAFLN